MKSRFPVNRLLQAALTFSLIFITLYTVLNYSSLQELINVIVPTYPPTIPNLLFLVLILLGAYALWGGTESGRGPSRFATGIMILICTPIFLAFSSHNWLEVVGINISTPLSSRVVLAIAGVMVTAHFSLYYLNSLLEAGSSLLDRGAGSAGVAEVHLKRSALTFAVISTALLAATSVFLGATYLQDYLAQFMAAVPAEVFALGFGASLVVVLVLYAVLVKRVGFDELPGEESEKAEA